MSKELEKIEHESFGPAMLACRADEREFVLHVMQGKPFAEAARLAGWGAPESNANTMARIGFRLSHRDRVIAAMAEETKKMVRASAPRAVRAVNEILDSYHHKDRARVALSVVERIDPTIQKSEISVTHTITHEDEALQQLRALRALNVARDKLIELYGDFGLERLEKKLAVTDQSKVIDVGFTEVRDPDFEILGE